MYCFDLYFSERHVCLALNVFFSECICLPWCIFVPHAVLVPMGSLHEPDEDRMKAMFKITDDARFFPGDSRQDRFDRAHENYKSTCQNSRQSCRNPRHVVVDKHFVFDLLLLWCFSRSKERSAH